MKGSFIVDFGNQRAKIPSAVGRFQRIRNLGNNAVNTISKVTVRPIRRTVMKIKTARAASAVRHHRPIPQIHNNATINTSHTPAADQSTSKENADSSLGPVTSSSTSSSSLNLMSSDLFSNNEQRMTLTIDPASFLRLAIILTQMTGSLAAVTIGTLRLLAPMIVARRTILTVADVIVDYLRGRYFRTTYSRLERVYLRYYEAPAALRAMARTASQISIFFLLSSFMSWLVGTNHPPCRAQGRGLAFVCGLLWIFSVVGTGHAFTQYVAKWGGPLRIQKAYSSSASIQQTTILQQVFVRPFHIIQFMQDPAQWLNMISTPQVTKPPAFVPNPLIFPITWGPLRIIQIMGLATVMCTDPCDFSTTFSLSRAAASTSNTQKLMRQFLTQLALGDEWCRVLIEEKRVGLGIVIVICYFFAILQFIISAATINLTASIWLLPSLVAAVVSGWLNIVIFWNRMEGKRKEEAMNVLEEKKKAFVKALTIQPPVY